MALISCPECGKQISDAANTCPHCGFPITSQATSSISEEKAVQSKINLQEGVNPKLDKNQNIDDFNTGCGVALFIVVLIAFFMLFRSCDSDSDSYSSSEGYGKYTSPSGKRQKQYQGSREQQRDLDMIDSYFGY